MYRNPHSRNLRKHRILASGVAYSISTRILHGLPDLLDGEAEIIASSLLWLRGDGRIQLFGFAVMPDHLHVLLLPDRELLPQVMKTLKGFTSRRLNPGRGMNGSVWQDGYFEHALRGPPDAWAAKRYIEENPVRAGIVERPEDYRFSSAHPGFAGQIDPIE